MRKKNYNLFLRNVNNVLQLLHLPCTIDIVIHILSVFMNHSSASCQPLEALELCLYKCITSQMVLHACVQVGVCDAFYRQRNWSWYGGCDEGGNN